MVRNETISAMKYGILTLESHGAEDLTPVAEVYRHIIDRAVEAERLGYDSFWITEHHFHPFGGVHPWPQMLLASIAERTKRIRLGTAVTLLPYWNPVEIAEQFAMLDQLSGGRVDFGIGRGFVRAEYDGWGLPMSESRPRFDESLEVIKRAWTEARLSHAGQFWSFANVEVMPKPLQRPHPPIWLAATITPESFVNAGQQGYALMVVPYVQPSMEVFRENVCRYVEAFRLAGHPGEPEVFAFLLTAIDEDVTRLRSEISDHVSRYFAASANAHGRATGERDASYSAFAQTAETNRTRDFDTLRRRHAALFGSPDHCIEEIRFLQREIGLTYLAIEPSFGGVAPARALTTMRRFMAEVVPALRQ